MPPKPIESLALPIPHNDSWREAHASETRVAIIGAGPLGIEAAHYGLRAGLSVRVFERDTEIASTIRQWNHLPLFTPWGSNRTPLGEIVLQERQIALPRPALYHTGADLVHLYLHPLAEALPKGVLETDTRVVGVARSYTFKDELASDPKSRAERRFRMLTRRGGNGEERVWSADFVLDCSGGGRVPAWVGASGLPAIGELGCCNRFFHFPPDIRGRDRIHFLGKSTLLVGDGPSAATSAVALSDLRKIHEQTAFAWAVRTRAEMPFTTIPADPLPRRDLLYKKANLLVKKGAPGMIFLPNTQVDSVRYLIDKKKFYITLQVGRDTRRIVFDSVIANVGTRPQGSYQRELIPGEMNFFAIGGMTRRPDGSDFLLSDGHRQILEAYQAITGNPTLDLYAPAAA
jgi:hypothetical protein